MEKTPYFQTADKLKSRLRMGDTTISDEIIDMALIKLSVELGRIFSEDRLEYLRSIKDEVCSVAEFEYVKAFLLNHLKTQTVAGDSDPREEWNENSLLRDSDSYDSSRISKMLEDALELFKTRDLNPDNDTGYSLSASWGVENEDYQRLY